MSGPEFKTWITEHMRLNGLVRWADDPMTYRPWKARLDGLKAPLDVCLAASQRVAQDPPQYPSEHIEAVCSAIVAIYRERDASGGTAAGLEERARRGDELEKVEVSRLEQLARDCPYCGGNGLAIRRGRAVPDRTITLHCTCILGRWIRERCRKTSPEAFRRIRDLAEHEWLNAVEFGGPDLDPAEFAGLVPAF